MNRFLLALAIPAALILSGCSTSPTDGDPGWSVTSTPNAQDGLAPTTEISAPNMAITIVETSTAPVRQTPEGVAILPSELQMCHELLGMMEHSLGADDEDRRESLANLRTENAASEDWKSKTADEKRV